MAHEGAQKLERLRKKLAIGAAGAQFQELAQEQDMSMQRGAAAASTSRGDEASSSTALAVPVYEGGYAYAGVKDRVRKTSIEADRK